ncbi:succinate--CoA ligase subunit alpha [Fervidibacter sacchari]|uniref:Succinate--CoA ligase [ADP-forming] subunit alpha n=1 Tax=Candidatus Fervidibacter sacchari TaxID=1448929 RepID=A0ABT2ENR1_9BACT|nr:succinate--CoA ligase subunit alpha [Candidatus Fervidibacter sacchari]MCS3919076.1 succinyl-CoA synthetase alpha subunit [Candidatus Fervidibacter sacchari]WKU17192.1 succinate--CoA ligase subunit alpha [Candidatus Fervidibacter sacchari]
MAILVNKDTRVLVQGITGREGEFHTKLMLEYGTKIVAGVTPGKGGQTVHGVPVFDSVQEAVDAVGQIDVSIVFVPAPFAADAILEALDAGIKGVVIITEGIPIQDMLKVARAFEIAGNDRWFIGPNCPGVITPGECKVGIMPAQVFTPGRIGVVSRSGTLTYEVVAELTKAGFGQSTCVGIGGDPIIGLNFVEVLRRFNDDPQTDAVVLIGEIGGTDEEEAAAFIASEMRKPVVAFVAGKTAPEGKRMGHAGAIIMGRMGTAQSKIEAFQKAGVPVADLPAQIPELLKQVLG